MELNFKAEPALKSKTLLVNLTIHGFFSLSGEEENDLTIDCKNLRFYNSNCPQVNDKNVHLDLNHQIEKTVRVDRVETPYTSVYMNKAKDDFPDVFGSGPVFLSDAKILTNRGFLRLISGLPYSSDKNFVIYCCLYRGVIFLCLSEKSTYYDDQKLSDWGFKFEQYMLADTPSSSPNISDPVNTGEKFYCIFRTSMGSHNLIYNAEVDGLVVEDEESVKDLHPDKIVNISRSKILDILNKSKFVETKTQNGNISPFNFGRNKSMKWWSHAKFGGNDFIMCGNKTKNGIIESITRYDTTSLEKNYHRFFDPSVCTSFCESFFSYIKECLKVELKKNAVSSNEDIRKIKKIELMFESTPTSIRLCNKYDPAFDLISQRFMNSFDQ